MIKLYANIPSISDATSFYRALGPLSDKKLRNTFGDIMLNNYDMNNWGTLSMNDACFFQRPYKKDHVSLIEIAKDLQKKVWVDYDDYLLEVPTDNPAHGTYNKESTKEAVIKCLQMADVVTVSTEYLKKLYEPYNKNIKVVRNALPMHLLKWRNSVKPERRTKSIAWRGSKTHVKDVASYAQPIIQTSVDVRFKDWVWYFVGDNQWMVTDYMPHNRTIWCEPMDPLLYFQEMFKIAPSVMQVPLHDNKFNRCKSNIAWLESAFCGSVGLVPAWEEWSLPGALTYNNQNDYKLHLEAVMMGEVDIEKASSTSWDYIQENLNIEQMNNIRAQVIKEIIE